MVTKLWLSGGSHDSQQFPTPFDKITKSLNARTITENLKKSIPMRTRTNEPARYNSLLKK